jgi:hypothetical protein
VGYLSKKTQEKDERAVRWQQRQVPQTEFIESLTDIVASHRSPVKMLTGRKTKKGHMVPVKK